MSETKGNMVEKINSLSLRSCCLMKTKNKMEFWTFYIAAVGKQYEAVRCHFIVMIGAVTQTLKASRKSNFRRHHCFESWLLKSWHWMGIAGFKNCNNTNHAWKMWNILSFALTAIKLKPFAPRDYFNFIKVIIWVFIYS